MQKRMLLAVLVAAGLVVPAFAQEETSPVSKSLTLYVDGGSGNINPNATEGANGSSEVLNSWGEYGVVYSQNFAKAQWLTLNTLAAVCTWTAPVQDLNGTLTSAGTGGFAGYASLKLDFTKYVSLGYNSAGKFTFYTGYSHAFAGNQYVKATFDMEVTPLAEATGADLFPLLQVRFDYGVAINELWAYSTDVRFRFAGNEDAQVLKDSFNIRWNNTISYYNDATGFGAYALVRYAPAFLPTGTRHEVNLNGGFSYSFDLAKL